jgi:hypothetical protein
VSSFSEMVRQESAALFRFVDSIVRRCEEIHEYPVYAQTSQIFLNYMKVLGNETKKFLEAFPESAEKDKRTANSKRRKLHSLRISWEALHEYLKPALDADTLHIPTPLILALQDEINQLEELKDLKFTVFHSDRVNYLQLPPGTIKETADLIADLVSGTAFPLSLGLVGMPYSQSNGFFLNCLLVHEMAHVAYQNVYSPDVSTQIDTVLEALEKEVGILAERDVTIARDTLEHWIEELFCDLSSICLIGPAYSFALIELTGATLLVDSPATTLDPFHSFMEYHPAEIARFHAHLMLLKKNGWWKEMEGMSTCYVKVFTVSESKSSDLRIETEIPQDVGDERFLRCFWEICSWLVDFVMKEMPVSAKTIDQYRRQSRIISEYFREAIVPSTIVIDGKREHPSPVVLINAAFRFYLENIPDLIENVEGGNPASVEARSRFAERLELWSLKAVEDCRLLESESKHGGRSQV